ncbi:unnamed protein product [Cyprideis torosa]|uniref:Uncharacterized protein n=1 Tax=Cyprideis torosa TaxID=163714 RepID=A0A7R8ZM63_9CRUS|nr:unnamed protein product [Cyprideis torosa]CAG0883617.1 unnamed protein product [Cyprideis torosa]
MKTKAPPDRSQRNVQEARRALTRIPRSGKCWVASERSAMSSSPEWLKILRWKTTSHVICVVVDPLAMRHVDELASDQKIQEAFTSRVEVVSPLRYDSSVPEELMLVPLSMNRRYKLTRAYGSIEGAVASGTLMQRMRAFFPITKDNNNMAAPIQDEPSAFSRLDLLLNVEQMLREKYPFPSNRAGAGRLDPVDELESSSCSGRSSDAGFRHSRSSYAEVTSNSPLFSLDCEMCQTASGEKVLTRVAVVDEDLKLVYHSFVKPHEEITDYLTEYSGVTPEMLFGVTKRLEDVQRELEEILPPDAILVGHSLSNDLHALKRSLISVIQRSLISVIQRSLISVIMNCRLDPIIRQIFHPYVIDTSVIYNLSGERSRKPKLAVLASSFLDLEIQTGGKLGHNPAEDSYATMKLLKLKLEKGYRFGDCVIDGPANDINPRAPHNFSELIFHFIRDRKVNVIGKSSVLSQYRSCLNQFRSSSNVELVEASCNKHIVTAVQDALPKGHLTIGHFCDAKEQNEAALISLTQKRLKRVWDSAPAKSIVLAILPGNQQENGACLLGVKE